MSLEAPKQLEESVSKTHAAIKKARHQAGFFNCCSSPSPPLEEGVGGRPGTYLMALVVLTVPSL